MTTPLNILILCTGNSCRSQMAQGILQSFSPHINVYSAGTSPSHQVHPVAIEVMQELGVDISHHSPQKTDDYLHQTFDYVITVCHEAKENCPTFVGKVKTHLHIGFEDPANAIGTREEVHAFFRQVRDEILRDFYTFFNHHIRPSTSQSATEQSKNPPS